MRTHAEMQVTKRQPVVQEVSRNRDGNPSTVRFVDNRSEALQLQKLQGIATNGKQANPGKNLQRKISQQKKPVIQKNGLRYLGSEPETLEQQGLRHPTYTIETRGRPVLGSAGVVATHCYLVLLDEDRNVEDSLSFDPSNSVGSKDASPENTSRGSVVLGTNQSISVWKQLKSSYSSFASAAYNLRNHNCCHAVMAALVASNLPRAATGTRLTANAASM